MSGYLAELAISRCLHVPPENGKGRSLAKQAAGTLLSLSQTHTATALAVTGSRKGLRNTC